MEIGSLFCSGVINPFESSKLWHHPSQHTMAFEAFRPSSQLAKLGVLYELCRGTFGTKGTFCGVSEVLEEGALVSWSSQSRGKVGGGAVGFSERYRSYSH